MNSLINTYPSRNAAREAAKQNNHKVIDLNSAAAKKEFSVAALSCASKQAVRWATIPKEAIQRPAKRVKQALYKYNQVKGYLIDAPRIICTAA